MTDHPRALPKPRIAGQPPTALAPMQDVTTLPFMQVIDKIGPPDYYFTEYFRVHEHSRLEPYILDSITKNPSDRPVFAQLIGEAEEHMLRTVKELEAYPIAGIDLNMGCPAPKVFKKKVGGGLLRDLDKIDRLLGTLRENISGLFTVKTRIGFSDTEDFEALLKLINKHDVDLLSLHGRTVKEMYRSEVHYDYIQRAAEVLDCPLLANGNITSVEKADWVLQTTGAYGVMIGRSAIRNPWIFRQIREHRAGQEYYRPTLKDVYHYIQHLYTATYAEGMTEIRHIARMKKFLNFVAIGVDPEGQFQKHMRRALTKAELDQVAVHYLLQNGKDEELFHLEPHPGLIARPNAETPQTCAL